MTSNQVGIDMIIEAKRRHHHPNHNTELQNEVIAILRNCDNSNHLITDFDDAVDNNGNIFDQYAATTRGIDMALKNLEARVRMQKFTESQYKPSNPTSYSKTFAYLFFYLLLVLIILITDNLPIVAAIKFPLKHGIIIITTPILFLIY